MGGQGVGHSPPGVEGLDMGESSGGMDSCLRRNDGIGGFRGWGEGVSVSVDGGQGTRKGHPYRGGEESRERSWHQGAGACL